MADSARWTLWISLCNGVRLLPNAEAALHHLAVHDGQADNMPRWRRRAHRMLARVYCHVLPEDASAEALLDALFQHDIVDGAWLQ